MKTQKWYSPDDDQGGGTTTGGGSSTGGSSRNNEGSHEPGNTPLDDQEELPGGFIHGHVGGDDEGSD